MNADLSLASLLHAIKSMEARAGSEASGIAGEPRYILVDPWAFAYALADRRKRRRMWRKMKRAGRVRNGRVIL